MCRGSLPPTALLPYMIGGGSTRPLMHLPDAASVEVRAVACARWMCSQERGGAKSRFTFGKHRRSSEVYPKFLGGRRQAPTISNVKFLPQRHRCLAHPRTRQHQAKLPPRCRPRIPVSPTYVRPRLRAHANFWDGDERICAQELTNVP